MRSLKLAFVASAVAAVTALGTGSAFATISPSSGTVTATSIGSVSLRSSALNDTCSSIVMNGAINLNRGAGLGGGGDITSWTTSGCLITPSSGPTAASPWHLSGDSLRSGSVWNGRVTNVSVTISFCTFSGTLTGTYDNSSGTLAITGGTLSGGLCGSATVSGSWRVSNSGTPNPFQLS